jgi:hypothetical protein
VHAAITGGAAQAKPRKGSKGDTSRGVDDK